jgi:hypothetical protein
VTTAILRTQTTATATCDSRDYTCSAEPGTCHEAAAAHRDETGHRLLVIEITTTAYEATP